MRLLTTNRQRITSERRGSATVEFAIIAPILATLMLGTVEITRAIQAKELLTDTARSGTRLGAYPGVSNSTIQSNVTAILTNNGINSADATTTISVNGSSTGDAKNAVRGDKITVQITIPISKINWVTPLFFPTTAVTSESVHMVRQ